MKHFKRYFGLSTPEFPFKSLLLADIRALGGSTSEAARQSASGEQQRYGSTAEEAIDGEREPFAGQRAPICVTNTIIFCIAIKGNPKCPPLTSVNAL